MRLLVLAPIVALAGCVIDNDRVRVDSFTADPSGTFTYAAATNTVMTENDDGQAEQIRRDWLAETLMANGMCSAGYVVDTRRLAVPADLPADNSRDIVYTGRCL